MLGLFHVLFVFSLFSAVGIFLYKNKVLKIPWLIWSLRVLAIARKASAVLLFPLALPFLDCFKKIRHLVYYKAATCYSCCSF